MSRRRTLKQRTPLRQKARRRGRPRRKNKNSSTKSPKPLPQPSNTLSTKTKNALAAMAIGGTALVIGRAAGIVPGAGDIIYRHVKPNTESGTTEADSMGRIRDQQERERDHYDPELASITKHIDELEKERDTAVTQRDQAELEKERDTAVTQRDQAEFDKTGPKGPKDIENLEEKRPQRTSQVGIISLRDLHGTPPRLWVETRLLECQIIFLTTLQQILQNLFETKNVHQALGNFQRVYDWFHDGIKRNLEAVRQLKGNISSVDAQMDRLKESPYGSNKDLHWAKGRFAHFQSMNISPTHRSPDAVNSVDMRILFGKRLVDYERYITNVKAQCRAHAEMHSLYYNVGIQDMLNKLYKLARAYFADIWAHAHFPKYHTARYTMPDLGVMK